MDVAGVKKRFGDVEALCGVDLRLDKGEWLGLLGPNGAGKSTLIRAIAGRVVPDEGTIRIFGEPNQIGVRRRLGIVPQEIALYGRLTTLENLRAFGELFGLSGKDLTLRIDRALAWSALTDKAAERVSRLSGGMQRRLNIACSVLHGPELLLLDEPTAGVDPQNRERIWRMLGELRAEGTSITLTTHQLDEAQQTCERIVIIDHGRVIADGSFDELVRKTIGAGAKLVVTLERPVDSVEGLVAQGNELVATVSDVAREIPQILARVETRGGKVLNLAIEQPTLQSVFIHLTGRELRE